MELIDSGRSITSSSRRSLLRESYAGSSAALSLHANHNTDGLCTKLHMMIVATESIYFLKHKNTKILLELPSHINAADLTDFLSVTCQRLCLDTSKLQSPIPSRASNILNMTGRVY